MVRELIENIYMTGIAYGILGTLLIEGIIYILWRINKEKKERKK